MKGFLGSILGQALSYLLGIAAVAGAAYYVYRKVQGALPTPADFVGSVTGLVTGLPSTVDTFVSGSNAGTYITREQQQAQSKKILADKLAAAGLS